ncbi:hypothetical protein FB451DRAFT_1386535 [Mycena latifolia]|nr:hypothetical protein FB451DRAFT_1386535 [Mycena latifolia]
MTTLLFALLLAFLISDALGSHHGHDIQPNRRSRRQSGTRTTQVYEVSDTPRWTRQVPLDIPHGSHHADEVDRYAAPIPPVVQTALTTQNGADPADHVPNVTVHFHSLSPGPVHTIRAPAPTPITPPCTPPKRSSSSSVTHDQVLDSESESHKDELQTPPSLANPRNLSLPPTFDNVPVGQASACQRDEDELQTPLALDLRDLPLVVDSPAVEQGQLDDDVRPLLLENIPFLDDPASLEDGADVPRTDGDDISELSLPTGTQLSIISDNDAQTITAKAELLRRQAWDEQKTRLRLEGELNEAVLEGNVKDAFLLRMEIDAAEERAQKMHGRAARRHFRGK